MKNALPVILILLAISAALVVTNLVTGFQLLRQRSQNQQLQRQLSEARPSSTELPAKKTLDDLAFAISRTTDLRLLKAVLDEHPELVNATTGVGHVTPLGIIRNNAGQTPLQ